MGQFGFPRYPRIGIIAAIRNNGVGMDGINDNVRIKTVKAAPDGDERDERRGPGYTEAVDNGAYIMNMSFGKGFYPTKSG